MNRKSSLAAALVLPLATVGLVAAGTSSTSAAQRHDVAAATQRVAAGPRIQGVVADTSGHYLDDVDVRAVSDRGVAASALTYANNRSGGPPHGFFNLSVHSLGTYTVTFSLDGYVSQSQVVEVTRRQRVVHVDEVELKAKPRATRTVAKLKDASITTDDKARVTVQVSTTKPVGTVTVKIGGREVGSDTLTASDGGSVTIGLPKQGVGTYQVKAYYGGSKGQNLAPSSSDAVQLKVAKPARHHR